MPSPLYCISSTIWTGLVENQCSELKSCHRPNLQPTYSQKILEPVQEHRHSPQLSDGLTSYSSSVSHNKTLPFSLLPFSWLSLCWLLCGVRWWLLVLLLGFGCWFVLLVSCFFLYHPVGLIRFSRYALARAHEHWLLGASLYS